MPSAVALLWLLEEAEYRPRNARPPERRLSPRQRLALEHQPLVLIQGQEHFGWQSAGKAFLERLAAAPAKATIRLQAAAAEGAIVVQAAVTLPADAAQAALYLTAYAEGARGERLALAWQGPFAVSRGTQFRHRSLPVVPGAAPERSGVAAFVRGRSGEVLQALTLPPCPG